MPVREYRLSRQRRDFHDALPAPLPDIRSRPRALSLSSDSQKPVSLQQDQHKHEQQPQQQSSPLLCRLPAEIRLLIWEYAIGGQKIHVISKYRRLGHAVCNDEYWAESRSERPGLRASSYLFTYGALPTTLQLADWSMCSLLMTCRQIYAEAVCVLYETNTFVFFDLRTISIFQDVVLPRRWAAIRSIEIYAAYFRKDDILDAIEGCSLLQLEAWPTASLALQSLPHLRNLRVFIGEPIYLDLDYLRGGQCRVYEALLSFLWKCKIAGSLEVFIPKRSDLRSEKTTFWIISTLIHSALRRVEGHVRMTGVECNLYSGDIESSEEDIERRDRHYLDKEEWC